MRYFYKLVVSVVAFVSSGAWIIDGLQGVSGLLITTKLSKAAFDLTTNLLYIYIYIYLHNSAHHDCNHYIYIHTMLQ